MIAVLGGLADVERDLIRTRTAEAQPGAKAWAAHGPTAETHRRAESRSTAAGRKARPLPNLPAAMTWARVDFAAYHMNSWKQAPGFPEMQLKRFKAIGVHGYLDFDITFNQDITFLTGINGSGKTSVVQSIISLITPSLFTLANLSFILISVDIENDGVDITITAKRQDNVVTLQTTNTKGSFFTIPPFVSDPDELTYRNSERENQFYLEITTGRNRTLKSDLLTLFRRRCFSI